MHQYPHHLGPSIPGSSAPVPGTFASALFEDLVPTRGGLTGTGGGRGGVRVLMHSGSGVSGGGPPHSYPAGGISGPGPGAGAGTAGPNDDACSGIHCATLNDRKAKSLGVHRQQQSDQPVGLNIERHLAHRYPEEER